MPDRRTAIGIDIGGTNLRVAVISETGTILRRLSDRVPRGKEAQLRRICELTQRVAGPNVEAVGIGVAGRIRPTERKVLSAGFLDLENVDLGEEVEQIVGKPVVVDNDSRMAMFAELKIGAAIDRMNVVMFTIGTGIGGAIVQNGALSYGNGNAGQLGHLTVDRHGPVCRCGRRGCVETLSSGTALGAYIAAAGLPASVSIADLFARDANGDRVATDILTNWAAPLREAVDSTVAVLDPDLVLLGGGLGAAAWRALRRLPSQSPWYRCPVEPAKLGDDAGIVGAALKALAREPAPAEDPGRFKSSTEPRAG